MKTDGRGYTAASGYIWLRSQHSVVPWSSWVWNRLNQPKHRFICWMAMWGRLKTKASLCKLGITDDCLCPLCGDCDETVQHLFWECEYSQKCRDFFFEKTSLHCQITNLQDCTKWLANIKGRFKRRVIQAAIAGLIYATWRQRNLAIWEKKIMRPEIVARRPKNEVLTRIKSVLPKKTNRTDVMWLHRLFL